MGQAAEAFYIDFAPDNIDPELSLDTQNRERVAILQKVLEDLHMPPVDEEAFLAYLNLDLSEDIGHEEALFLISVIENLYNDERILGNEIVMNAISKILKLHTLMGEKSKKDLP